MSNYATEAQVSYIKSLGRQLGLLTDGDAADMNHVLSIATFGRVGHWASLSRIEARMAIERLKAEISA